MLADLELAQPDEVADALDLLLEQAGKPLAHPGVTAGSDAASIRRLAATSASAQSRSITVTVDDEASGSASGARSYEVVLPGEAVRLDTRNIMYDSDGMLSTDILVGRQGEPPLKLRLGPAKGGDGGVLLRAPLAEEHDKTSAG